jgi:hypothetical protein
MASSMVVAHSRATADGHTLLGHNNTRPAGEPQSVVRVPGRSFAQGETVMFRDLCLPQVRHSFGVIAGRPSGEWGYWQGVNEPGVGAATTAIFSRVEADRPTLTGPDLVRLILERAATALQGVDVVTDLISRHGQGRFPGCGDMDAKYRDCALLIADPREAYLLAAAGSHWAVQEVGAVRAVTNVCQVRQDWNRVSRGLADLVLRRGWWPEDGSKIDFEGTVSEGGPPASAGLRRWGHATVLLEEQNGHIDGHFLRRLLSDHYEGCLDEADPFEPQQRDNTLCRHAAHGGAPETAASMIADLAPSSLPLSPASGERGRGEGVKPLAWWAFGPPCQGVYFPIVFDGDFPAEFAGEGPGAIDSVWRRMLRLNREVSRAPGRRQVVCETMSALQARFDVAALDYLEEAGDLQRHGDAAELHRLATAFMRHNLEHFEDAWLAMLEDARAGLGLAATPG